jgi:hypothetical protein
MGTLVNTCLGSSYLIAHVLHCPPPPPTLLPDEPHGRHARLRQTGAGSDSAHLQACGLAQVILVCRAVPRSESETVVS